VRLPNDRKEGGFIELHNRHIAIVTLLDRQAGHPMDVERLAGLPYDGDDETEVAGRAFESGCLMTAKVKLAPFGDQGQFDPDQLELDPPHSRYRMRFWRPVSSYEGGPVVCC
jgi:hypothetical protein